MFSLVINCTCFANFVPETEISPGHETLSVTVSISNDIHDRYEKMAVVFISEKCFLLNHVSPF